MSAAGRRATGCIVRVDYTLCRHHIDRSSGRDLWVRALDIRACHRKLPGGRCRQRHASLAAGFAGWRRARPYYVPCPPCPGPRRRRRTAFGIPGVDPARPSGQHFRRRRPTWCFHSRPGPGRRRLSGSAARGKIGLAHWTRGFIGQLFKTIAAVPRTAGILSPALWGTRATDETSVCGAPSVVACEHGHFVVPRSAEQWLQVSKLLRSVLKAFAACRPPASALGQDLCSA